MAFIRKYPLFSAWLGLCALVFAGSLILTLLKQGAVARESRELETAETRYRSLVNARPAPTEVNLARSEENLETLIAALQTSIADLSADDRLVLSDDPIEVMPRIQRMIRDLRRQARVDYIALVADEAFGFARYSQTIDPPARSVIPLLDKQRQIIRFLVTRLFESADPENPLVLSAVQREWIESDEAPTAGRAGGDLFEIAPAMSARRAGAIDTLAFRFRFTGYTEVLRRFLNRMAAFDLPVVVRSVEVSQAEEDRPASRSRSSAQDNFPFDLFGDDAAGDDEDGSGDSPASAPVRKEPVIENNRSTFSVVIEYVDVVLDADALLNPDQEVLP